EYSNLGAGLLGHALARRAGSDYETSVRSRILQPLKMNSTTVTLSAGLKARMAQGHDESLAPVSNWDLDALAGAGALRSTANDMLTFLAAFMGYSESPLRPAMRSMLSERRPAEPRQEIGLAWLIQKAGEDEIIWHNGGTGGFRSFTGYNPKTRTGVIVLS